MLELEDEQDAFVENVTVAQIKKWRKNPSDYHLITEAYDLLESLLARGDGDTSWISDHVADLLEFEAIYIKEREKMLREKEASEAKLRKEMLREKEASEAKLKEMLREMEASEAKLREEMREEIRGLKRKSETRDAEFKAFRAKQEAEVSVWSNLMAHDPSFSINASSTHTTSIPHFYSPDSVVPWDFAGFNECAYSFSELQEFVGKLVAFEEKRSAFPESIVYLREYKPGTSEQCLVDIMRKLCEAVKHILTTTNEPNSDQLSYKANGLYGIFDFVSGTPRQPDGIINLASFPVCMIEYKTNKTLKLGTLENYNKAGLPKSEVSAGRRIRYARNYQTVQDPVTQVCSYMMLTGCRYGILSNWGCTYFLKLDIDESGKTTLHYSEIFKPWTATMAQRANAPGAEAGAGAGSGNITMGNIFAEQPVSLLQAMTVFVHLVMKDETLIPSGLDFNAYNEAVIERIKGSNDKFPGNGPNMSRFVSNVKTSTEVEMTCRQAGSGDDNSERDSLLAVLTVCTSKGSVVRLHGAYGVGFSDSTLKIAGTTFKGCFAKASLYLDDESSYDTGYNLNNEQATRFMDMLVKEARLYNGAARALQGSVLPVVHYSGEFPIGGGFYFMIVMSNTGHSLRSEVGQRTARSVGLNTVHSQVHALLDQLHGAGITHGDMGLRNVTIQENGTVRLVDLGMASLDLCHCRQDHESFDAEWTRVFGRVVASNSMLRRFSSTQLLKSLRNFNNGSDQS